MLLLSTVITAVRRLNVTTVLASLNNERSKPKKTLKLLPNFDWRAKAPGIKKKADAFAATVPATAPAKLALVQCGMAFYAVVVEKRPGHDKWTVFDFGYYKGNIVPHLSMVLDWTGHVSSSKCSILRDHGEWNLVGLRMQHLKDGDWSYIF